MSIVEHLLHFFTPRHTNNHKAKALHISSISLYITLLLIFQIGLTLIGKIDPRILGYASNITVSDLLADTNSERAKAGLSPLHLDPQLSQAAAAKAADMFANQYWAHTSPQGKDPWSFILTTGYNYLFAGENLARDFGDSQSVVTAWMNSPSHRDNLLNSRYQDIGFAVVNGKYGDHETTLVVQDLGARSAGQPTVQAPETPQPAPSPASSVPTAPAPAKTGQVLPVGKPPVSLTPPVSLFAATKTISLGLVVVLMGVLMVDSLLVYRRKVVRLSGHNFAHLLLLLAALAALNLVSRGVIL